MGVAGQPDSTPRFGFWVGIAGIVSAVVAILALLNDIRMNQASGAQGPPPTSTSVQSGQTEQPSMPTTVATPTNRPTGTPAVTTKLPPTTPSPLKRPTSAPPSHSARPRYWPLGSTPTSAQILACNAQVERELKNPPGSQLTGSRLKPGDVGQEVTLRITIDGRDTGYYLWVRDAACKPRKVLALQPGDKSSLRGAWTGGYATLVPFDDNLGSFIGQEGAINPDVDWTGGASYRRESTTMLWSWG